ncbi:alpha/beta hydrolase family protein [Tsuneonella mangrovi]|uniref:alpha/beta hydrolase family protein n=1 Tax=Tsuneonella mangrovi TaxID=1982042 RepID=UPI000BA27DB4|nr:alpha/beta hydrolase [Tsuneonella mangrovi]
MKHAIRTGIALIAICSASAVAQAQPPEGIPAAIYTDPPHDAAHPARLEVLHIPSGVETIYGLAYLAVGAGTHPTVVLCHGWPGNEKNLDLAQAMRRDGWNVVTFNYRGSWGSPGTFSFAQNPEDAKAVLAYLRDPENAAKLGIDTSKMVLMGHSMGGWVTAEVASEDTQLAGAVLISAANMGLAGKLPYRELYAVSAGNAETLSGATAQSMSDELKAHSDDYDLMNKVDGLTRAPLLVLTADDGLAASADALVAAIRKAGGTQVTVSHAATDHSWSDHRIDLESRIINWLDALK